MNELPPLTLRDVAQIFLSSGGCPATAQELSEMVELPLRAACTSLYEKGVQTLSSSANREGVKAGAEAWILVNFESLSPQNQDIATHSGVLYRDGHNNGGRMTLKLMYPAATWDTPVQDVHDWAMELASRFEEQPMTWAPRWTLEQLRAIMAVPADDTDHDASYYRGRDYAYDPESRLFYVNEEQMMMAKRAPKPYFRALGTAPLR